MVLFGSFLSMAIANTCDPSQTALPVSAGYVLLHKWKSSDTKYL
jgi:hypothetical protein